MTINITAQRRRELAEKVGVNEQYLYQCLTGRRDMGPAEAMRLETDTAGELTRQMLCQKTHASIWPQLAEVHRKTSIAPARRPAAAIKGEAPTASTQRKQSTRRTTGRAS